jgi:manganese-dependent ADP-ribose/CDP-alcohol diphosphatase
MTSAYLKSFIIAVLLLLNVLRGLSQEQPDVRLGIFTDCQYCNCTEEGIRFYSLSLRKLDSCIREFNTLPLDAVFHLGDMIDHGFENYDSILPRFKQFQAPLHLVLGNHDYMIKSAYKSGLKDYIGMKEAYYRIDIGQWSIIVLNGDDLSYFAPQTKKQREERNTLVGDLFSAVQPNGMPWNGGIGSDQMKWLDSQLTNAEMEKRKVIIACHFPLFSKGNHNLFNNHELFMKISLYHCVKAYFSGHFHAGYYHEMDGIQLVNFKGMVDTKINSFAVVTLTSDSILINGYGREPDRRLGIRK